MTTTVRVRSGSNTMVSSVKPDYAYGGPSRNRLTLDSGAAYALIRFALQPGSTIPRGAVVTGARLKMAQVGDWPTLAGRTLTASVISGSWKDTRATWTNQPAITAGSGVGVLDTVSSDLDYWTWDLTTSVAAIFSGTVNWGWRIETTDPTPRDIRGFGATQSKPYLEIDYVVLPAAPTDLNPSAAAVSIASPVLAGTAARDMTSYQVQVDPAANATDPLYDSGEVISSALYHNLATFTSARTASITRTAASTTVTAPAGTFARADIGATIVVTGIPAGATITAVASATSATISAAATTAGTATTTITRSYGAGLAVAGSTQWRARVKNGAGWSAWSSWVGFSRTAKPTVTIVNPTATSNDNTPPTTWTVAGGTQTAWEVFTRDAAGKLIDDSGRVPGTGTAYTSPAGVPKSGATYTTEVRIWDATVRDATPGDPVYASATRSWTFSYSATPAAVTSLVATSPGAAPWVTLTFVRSALPDAWVIERDGGIIATLLSTDLTIGVSGTTYTWVDWTAAPNRSHTYTVRPKVNNAVATTAPPSTLTPSVSGVWIGDPVNNADILIVGADEPDAGYAEDGDTFTPLGRPTVVNINSSKRGLEGTVTGALASVYGRSVLTEIDRLYNLKGRDAEQFRLVWADVNIPAVLSLIDPRPRRVGTAGGRVMRTFSLRFAQDGELPFDWSV